MRNGKEYADDYYATRHSETKPSARHILGLVFDYINPSSVIDFGCGVGTWLQVAKDLGAAEVYGLEGPWVDKEHVVISDSEFARADLSEPYRADKEYSLAIALEVAEHLDKEEADVFLDSLTNASACVLFSAAIPHQGGQCHVNEQWQTYWIEKFRDRGMMVFDVIRPKIWDRGEVKVWYRQNTFLFIREKIATSIMSAREAERNEMFNLVHPRMYLKMVRATDPLNMPYSKVLRRLPRMTVNALLRQIQKIM